MIYSNIVSLCKKKSIAISKLEREVGLGNATIKTWKTSSPSVDKLKKVADFFGVTVDDLISDRISNLETTAS